MSKRKLYIYKDEIYQRYNDCVVGIGYLRRDGSRLLETSWESCSKEAYEQAKYYGKPLSEKGLLRRVRDAKADEVMNEITAYLKEGKSLTELVSRKDNPVRSKEAVL